MIQKNDILIAVFTCKKYHNTRIKVATETWMKFIPVENLYIFSDYEQEINGYKTIKRNEQKTYSQDSRLNDTIFAQAHLFPFFLSKKNNYKIFVHLYDDAFYDIDRMAEIYNQHDLQTKEIVYSGKVTHYYNNEMKTPCGYVHGGFGYHLNAKFIQLVFDDICDVEKFNKIHNDQILRHNDIKYIDDKRVGISAKTKKVFPIELFHNGDHFPYCWGALDKFSIINTMKTNNYGTYHFYDQTVENINIDIKLIQKRSLSIWYDMYKIIESRNNL